MLHNTGYSAALFSLVDLPGGAELLAALLADGRAGLVRASYPGETADRIGLLCGVNSFHQGDLPAAREHLEEFLHGQSRLAAETTAQPGWRKLARFLADAIVVQTTEADGPVPSALRLPADSGLSWGRSGHRSCPRRPCQSVDSAPPGPGTHGHMADGGGPKSRLGTHNHRSAA
jgi:hypothetical protein